MIIYGRNFQSKKFFKKYFGFSILDIYKCPFSDSQRKFLKKTRGIEGLTIMQQKRIFKQFFCYDNFF